MPVDEVVLDGVLIYPPIHRLNSELRPIVPRETVMAQRLVLLRWLWRKHRPQEARKHEAAPLAATSFLRNSRNVSRGLYIVEPNRSRCHGMDMATGDRRVAPTDCQ